MIFSTLQKNSPYIYFALPIFILGFWIKYLIYPQVDVFYYDINPMPLYKFFLKAESWGMYALPIFNLLFLSLNVVILTRLNTTHRLIEKGTLIYTFIFILICANFSVVQQFNPILPALALMLMGIKSIFKMYKNERGLQEVYEAGFCFGLASLFYANSIFISIFIFASLFSLVPFNWRQWTSGFIGIATPIFITFSLYFLKDSLPSLVNTIQENTIIWKKSKGLHYSQIIFLGIIGILMIGSFITSFSSILKKVSSKKYYGLLLLLIFIIAIIFFAVPAAGKEIFFFTTISFVFYVSNYMVNLRSVVLQELFFILLIVSTIVIQVVK